MGRSKAPASPGYKKGELRYGNQAMGQTYYNPATKSLVSQYLPDAAEIERKNLTQKNMNSILSSLGWTSPEMAQQFDSAEKAYVEDSTKKFMEQYDPTLRTLREDVASRFGTLNSSQFLNGLNDLEKTRTSAFADIINQGKLLKNDLVNQDEARKLQNLSALSGILNSDNTNSLNNMQASSGLSQQYNDYLNNQWMAKLNDYRQDVNSKRAFLASMINTASKFIPVPKL